MFIAPIYKKFLEELESRDIYCSTDIPSWAGGGYLELEIEEIDGILKDADAFWCKRFNVTPELVKEFEFNEEEGQCHGITKKGKRCQVPLYDFPRYDIRDYIPERDNYCYLHKPKT